MLNHLEPTGATSELRKVPAQVQTLPNMSLLSRFSHAQSKGAFRLEGTPTRYFSYARRRLSASA